MSKDFPNELFWVELWTTRFLRQMIIYHRVAKHTAQSFLRPASM